MKRETVDNLFLIVFILDKYKIIRIFTPSGESVFYCSHHAKYVDTINNGEQLHTNQYEEANKLDQQIIADLNNEDMCNVYRSEIGTDQKNRSFGLLVTFLSCHVVIGFTESIKSEKCRRVTVKLAESFCTIYPTLFLL